MEDSVEKKRTIWHALICVGLVCLIWGGYFLAKHYGTDRILDIREDDFSWVYQVEEVETEGKNFVLRGFAFELNVDATEGAFEIVLQDIESGERYFPKMEYRERIDVNKYFLCGYDYLDSGFEATIKTKKLNLIDGHYEILLRDAGERKTYQTGTYISKGEIMYTNPLEYVPLDVTGTDLEEIVEHGVLRVYRPDYDMYVYQCGKELYWITGAEYDFIDGDDRIQCQYFTTQINKLPEKIRENGKKSIDENFWFKKREILDWDTGEYRVAKQNLPTECSITRIQVGKWEDEIGWIWRERVCPDYTKLIKEDRG